MKHRYKLAVFYGGIGGIALGYQLAHHEAAQFDLIGSFDVDPQACEDHENITGRPQTCMDLFDESQYIDYHGKMPPKGWRPVTGRDILDACNGDHPDAVALSAPCQGLSGLLSNAKAADKKYAALNRLTIRGISLMLEAWAASLPALIIFENVPRISTRGRYLLDIIQGMLKDAGYLINETMHDCGELAGLAQSRKRFLMVARLASKVPAMLWEPPKKALRPIRDVLYQLPLPDDLVAGGDMHRVPRLQWKTWVRLAMIPPGKDWRALRDLDTSRYRLLPNTSWHRGMLGVRDTDKPMATVTAMARTSTGPFSVADKRYQSGSHGVLAADKPSGAVTGQSWPSNGRFSVVDERYQLDLGAHGHHSKMRVEDQEKPAHTVTGSDRVGSGAPSIADGRFSVPGPSSTRQGKKYAVTDWTDWSRTVIAGSTTGQGAFALEDRRVTAESLLPIGNHEPDRDLGRYQPYGVLPDDEPSRTVTATSEPGAGPYSWAHELGDVGIHGLRHNNVYRVVSIDEPAPAVTGGTGPSSGGNACEDIRFGLKENGTGFRSGKQAHYGILDLDQTSKTVIASAQHDRGPYSVADERFDLPADKDRPDPPPIILSPHSGCWHRPFTTYELAMLQSFPTHLRNDPFRPFVLVGKSDSDRRRRIGNAVPQLAAKAMAEEMLHTLELSRHGVTLNLRGDGTIWVERVQERQKRMASIQHLTQGGLLN